MKRILILGATGMLGSALYDEFKNKYSLVLSVRDTGKIDLLENKFGGTKKHRVVRFDVAHAFQDFIQKKGAPGETITSFLREAGDFAYAVNAIGITIPYATEDPALTFFINGAFPHILAKLLGNKFIHITTDCVYNGTEGFPYSENSPKSPVDIYGLSKSMGEPTQSLTLRTSIIGRELEGFTGLLEWFLQQKGKEINGFSEHFWNGVTTKQFAKLCMKIIDNPSRFPKTGLYHVFSTPVSKLDMLKIFQKKFGIDCVINESRDSRLHRTLSTVKKMNALLKLPSFQTMVNEL